MKLVNIEPVSVKKELILRSSYPSAQEVFPSLLKMFNEQQMKLVLITTSSLLILTQFKFVIQMHFTNRFINNLTYLSKHMKKHTDFMDLLRQKKKDKYSVIIFI